MYEQVEKPRKIKTRPSVNSISDKREYVKQEHGNGLDKWNIQKNNIASKKINAKRQSVVQRKMGMEFESGVKVVPVSGDIRYKDKVYTSENKLWSITVDDVNADSTEGVLEFVTEPLESKEEVEAVMSEISKFIEKAKIVLIDGPITADALAKKVELGGTGASHLLVGEKSFTEDMFNATPQMSVGVPLNKLINLMAGSRKFEMKEYQKQSISKEPEYLSYDQTSTKYFQGGDRAETDELINAIEWGKSLIKKNANSADIDKVVGLMALVLNYLNAGHFKRNPSEDLPPYAKSYFPIMARTDFHTMYKNLGKAKEFFTISNVLNLWGCSEDYAKKLNVMKWGYKDGKVNKKGPTVYDWILSIIEPKDKRLKSEKLKKTKDLLSRGEVAHNSESMGAMEMDQNLVVVEYRQFPAGPKNMLAPDNWGTLVESLFTFTESIKKDDQVQTEDVLWSKDVMLNLEIAIQRQLSGLLSLDKDLNEKIESYRKIVFK